MCCPICLAYWRYIVFGAAKAEIVNPSPVRSNRTVTIGSMGRPQKRWHEALFNRRMLICVFTGFSSGLPLWLLINLLPAWLRSEQVDLTSIGLFALMQLPFTWKFLWSPLLDRYALPMLGRRRGWMLVTQIALLISIPLFGLLEPKLDLWTIAGLAALVAFFSASQDIVLDAYRRELLPDAELGLGTSIHVQAYRVSSLIPGALALVLADHIPWHSVFLITALFMLPGIANTLLVSEPARSRNAPRTLTEAVVEPFHEFITRAGWHQALLILGFIFLYNLGASMATALATPFYLDMGFSTSEIGFEALGVGLATAAFIAFIARATDPRYTATQFALFTSLAVVPRTLINATTGGIVEQTGWFDF